jgi:hypothetical protein
MSWNVNFEPHYCLESKGSQTTNPNRDALLQLITQETTRSVSHCGLAIYIKKYLKAKEESLNLKYFTMQKYNLQKPV